jgi:hypothetical protein
VFEVTVMPLRTSGSELADRNGVFSKLSKVVGPTDARNDDLSVKVRKPASADPPQYKTLMTARRLITIPKRIAL